MKSIDLKEITKSETPSELVLEWHCSSDDKLFFNGYQTWTTSTEHGASGRQRGANSMPRPIVNHWGIDRYGDYHFIKYDNQPGHLHGFSYCYKRCGDEFNLIASTDESDGYTIFYYDASQSELRIVKDIPADAQDANASEPTLHLFAACGTEEEVFDAWFEAMGTKAKPAVPLAGYSSWYNRYEDISDATITADLEGCAKVLEPGDLFQIDDGWQVTVGEWNENAKFPNGMKANADAIHEKGFLAGLWLAPFVTTSKGFIYKEHPDWLLQYDGKPWYCGCNWGGFYSLDIDHPGVRDYLRSTFDKVFNEWGFDLVKLDFLYAVAPWHSEEYSNELERISGESRGARMCRAMKLLREWCGDKLILGCGVPLWPAFGLVDYCRISCDVGLDWRNNWIMRHTNNECVSTVNAITNSYYRRQLNGRAFLNDPDVFFLRRDNIKLSEEEKLLLGRVNAQYGGILLCSDNMGEYDEQQLDQYKELLEIWRDKTWTDLDFLKALN